MDPRRRYFVPDLSPQARPELRRSRPRVVFVAESPHTSEVVPESARARRPLCGAAGRAWWSMLSEILEGHPDAEVSLKRLLALARKHGVVVVNAVQFPLDPKITTRYPGADPMHLLGFAKIPGPHGFRRRKDSPELQASLSSLRKRLEHPSIARLPIYALGGDAEWFVTHALGASGRLKGKIPHPSAWRWGRRLAARRKLTRILKGRQKRARPR